MNIAIIFAGGVGKRMTGSAKPKQFLKLFNKEILIHTLEHFENCSAIDAIVLVMVETHIQLTEKLIHDYKITKVYKVVPGGETGQMSIYHGLCAAKELSQEKGCFDSTIVLIHDGVRPIIDEDLILRNIDSVKEYGSAISCVYQKETTVLIDDNKNILSTTDRPRTMLARAPQSFYLKDILDLHEKCLAVGEKNMIDSCTMMMHYGKQLHIVETKSDNIKITTPDDFFIAKAILAAKENDDIYGG